MPENLLTCAIPKHGGQLRQISERFRIPVHQLLDFSASIYPGGPPPSVIPTLVEALRHPAILRDYPDLESVELRDRLGLYAAVPPANILIANGVAPLISATIQALAVRRCLLPVPAFGEYRRIFENTAVEVHPFLLLPELDFRPDLEEMVSECKRNGCDALILTNPSGFTFDGEQIRVMVEGAARKGIRVLLDEAFIDFVPGQSISPEVSKFSNLFVFRSLTKFFSMAGLRVGYMAAPQHLARSISNFLAPWSISSLAALAAISSLSDAEYVSRTVNQNRVEREWLAGELDSIGMKVFSGSANFLLFRLPITMHNADTWERLIVNHRTVVRNCGSFEGLDASYLRVAVRTRSENQRLVRAVAAV